jgi:hypothetical protein
MKPTMYDQPAIVIIENGISESEHRIIGPFPSGDEANNWAFKHISYGIQWYWLPVESPAMLERVE